MQRGGKSAEMHTDTRGAEAIRVRMEDMQVSFPLELTLPLSSVLML